MLTNSHLARLLLSLITLVFWTSASGKEARIHLNQLGFIPQASKVAVVPDGSAVEFWLIDAETREKVMRGPLTQVQKWDMANEKVKIADFSDYNKPGRYLVYVEGAGESYPFEIGSGVYDEALKGAIKGYYYNRASVALEEKFAGKFERPAGHPDTVVYLHPEAADKSQVLGTILSSPKGWYDAGDFNKYIVNSGITVYTLLKALEAYPSLFENLNLNIPESGNQLPDLLDEILWNLDWMETMQDPKDGGVYHKLSTLRFTSLPAMPHMHYKSRFMLPKTTAATLDFAAVMALASRSLKPYENQLPGYAERYRQAAESAWQWAKKNPKKLYVQPKDVNTGEYARRNDNLDDEFLWAATELYLSSDSRAYLKHIDIPKEISFYDWGDVGMLALFSIVDDAGAPSKLKNESRQVILQEADKYLEQYWESAYRVPMIKRDFIWGSNSVALNKAITLLYAARIQPEKDYGVVARALFDYIYGRNPMGYSYVTGYGSKTPMHIHHRISESDGIVEPVPGLLAGGPNFRRKDDCQYSSAAPAKSYTDKWCSYSTNEIAINWNAPLVYLLAAMRDAPR